MPRRRLPKFLSETEAGRFSAAARSERDRVIIALGFYAGLRVSEICKLKIEDLDLDEGTLLVQHGKGDKDRYLPVPAKLSEVLGPWLGARRRGYVIPSPRGGHYDSRTLQRMIARTARDAGIQKRVTPHVLRHTYATRLLNTGANLREVQELLGHSSVRVTEVYTHTTPGRLRGAVERL